MKKSDAHSKGIPVSISLKPTLEANNLSNKPMRNKRRMVYIMFLAVVVAALVSVIAKGLIYLIDLITNLAFFGHAGVEPASPATHHLEFWVLLVPIAGGIVVGLMALYGSKAIRGHGIPEAMEQVLTNESRIRPSITFLKPLSAAISIGTGGPFGAEGPIIASGGALGSTFGQLLHITPRERKTLLAAGATAGMSAIFGSPVAAIFLAIELLLFEFSPRAILPVTLACITGAAGHHFLFEPGPVFNMRSELAIPSNFALLFYSMMGIVIGLFSVLTTKLLYLLEDLFERLPIHWMWWPAIGGFFVGLVGIFNARTLGVGYENITDLLRGNLVLQTVISLCALKFLSWVIALSSGTSGGTLAPLLTIGGGLGALLGYFGGQYFPNAEISLSMAALLGMSAMFAGASRALMTSVIFALETTHQSNALVPLLACCTASYLVSFFIMENTIMTEKIARRGVCTPDSYEPDVLAQTTVIAVAQRNSLQLKETTTIAEARRMIMKTNRMCGFFVVVDEAGHFTGIARNEDVMSHVRSENDTLSSIDLMRAAPISANSSLRLAAEIMATEGREAVAVTDIASDHTTFVTYKEIIKTFTQKQDEVQVKKMKISVKFPGAGLRQQ